MEIHGEVDNYAYEIGVWKFSELAGSETDSCDDGS